MEGARIRPEAEDDLRAIAEVGRAAWDAAYRGLIADELIEAQTVERRVERRIARRAEGDPERRTWIVEDDGGVRGYCSTGPFRGAGEAGGRIGEVYSLYLHPDRWDRGWGRELLERAVEDLFGRGYAEIRLWCLSTNPRARRFYERSGFGVVIEEEPKELDGVDLPHTLYRLRG